MKLVILAAWKWTRLKPLTNTVPKPLIKIVWKAIVEHNLENIINDENKNLFDEIIFIVKYKKEKIIEYFWESYNWVEITYHEQWNDKWTWWALRWIKFEDDFLLINWDSIFEKKDLDKIIKSKNYSALVLETNTPEKYGIFKQDSEGYATSIIEKPTKFIWNLANLWVYKFSSEVLKLVEQIELSSRWEYEITDAINLFFKNNKFKLFNIEGDFIDIWYTWDILTANIYFLEKLEKSIINWKIEDWVIIKGNIILEKGAILKSWTYIEWNCYIWKNTSIWPNIYLRWMISIWEKCKIWANNEIKNSSIWDNTNIAHLSYIWDSIIWNNVNIWWWFISANLRHDKSNIKVLVNWNLVNTWLYKLWAIIGDNSKTWINSSSMPWRILENDSFTLPWETIK